MSYRIYVFIVITSVLWFQSVAYSQELTNSNSDYSEIFLGNEDVPLVALGREILSSNDLQACSPTNINQVNTFQPSVFHQTKESKPSKQELENLLLGFPLKALNRPMAIGAFHIDFSDNNNSYFQTLDFQEIVGQYTLSTFSAMEVRPKITASSDNKRCVLNFIHCPDRLKCHLQNSVFQASVLGVSAKHQALIVDPNEFGIHLNNEFYSIKPYSVSPFSPIMYLDLEDHRTYLIDFDESTLIFDVVATTKWQGPDPHPEVTTRWFLKFNLVESEKDFQSRPPKKGVGYSLNISGNRSYLPMRILRQRIFKDAKIKPIKYYVKNVPSRFQEGVRKGFEYWRSFFISLLGHPVLSYYFIQGDFDGGQEIIAGDIRYNVLEWHFSKHIHRAINRTMFNLYTGEVWSSNIILPGAQLIDLYQEWFEYSQFVRNSMSASVPEIIYSNALLRNLFGKSFQAPYSEDNSSYRTILLPLFPSEETFNSYMLGLIRNTTAHEIGHGLGLSHTSKANIFATEVYAGNSQMDYFALQDRHKPISGEYDKMALAYGYLGIPPKRTDMFCNWTNGLPECKRYDQGSKPLENAVTQLKEIVHLLANRSHPRSHPYLRWNVQVQSYFTLILNIILPFYLFAEAYYDQFQTVLIDDRKPENPQEVKDLVRNMLSDIFCDPELNKILNLKEPYRHSSPYDRQLQRNISFLFDWYYSNIQRNIDGLQY